jgi:hypothetical protein
MPVGLESVLESELGCAFSTVRKQIKGAKGKATPGGLAAGVALLG